jgi:hypothetical protein
MSSLSRAVIQWEEAHQAEQHDDRDDHDGKQGIKLVHGAVPRLKCLSSKTSGLQACRR